ncbi:PLDc_N domain-containing protein [Mycetocola manganoxydans]|uniref:PLDc_N domain-containing protein n=1 Tax=Mycetocola manganoxydans TaxID=699879 RepID=A0A3L6ZM99_9MICO|nr:PLD nuclease N-terminal domain-containing protein [Mycetocola manganoxydans]RLP69029.1 PLDc_N domain-containing protein [Mycetocola manganoxydans]GHD51862.1 membrane protein [Mycetocola manganoxydans]
MYVVVSALTLVLVVGALVDIITRQDGQVKHLPKMVWILLVVFLPLIGSILWFIIGREYPERTRRPAATRQATRQHPEPSFSTPRPESTEEQLLRVEREIEFYEKQARIRQLEAEADRRRLQAE